MIYVLLCPGFDCNERGGHRGTETLHRDTESSGLDRWITMIRFVADAIQARAGRTEDREHGRMR